VTKLEATGDTVPMTYQGRDGNQYVVVAAGGTNRFRMLANTGDVASDALIAFSLTGSGEPAARTQTARRSNAGQKPAADSGEVLPEGEGKAAVVRVCTQCHGTSVFTSLRLSRNEWSYEVSTMVERGAAASDEDIRGIVNYLAAHFGKPAR
jgi:quinoprotein glucose dehydrogenase